MARRWKAYKMHTAPHQSFNGSPLMRKTQATGTYIYILRSKNITTSKRKREPRTKQHKKARYKKSARPEKYQGERNTTQEDRREPTSEHKKHDTRNTQEPTSGHRDQDMYNNKKNARTKNIITKKTKCIEQKKRTK